MRRWVRDWWDEIVWRLRQRRAGRCPSHVFVLTNGGESCVRCGAAKWEAQIVDPNQHPEAVVVARLTTRLELILWDGMYHLVSGNGYLPNDLDFTFPEAPVPEPATTFDDNGNYTDPLMGIAFDEWFDRVERLNAALKVHPMTGEFLMGEFRLMGYGRDPSGHLAAWLMEKTGRIVAAFETRKETR